MPQVVPGNIDLYDRPKVKNPKGGTSTVYSASFNIDGKEVLLPLSDDGRILSEREAVDKYQRTGKHLGIFELPADATAYAQQLHKDYAAGKYEKRPMADRVVRVNGVEHRFPADATDAEISSALETAAPASPVSMADRPRGWQPVGSSEISEGSPSSDAPSAGFIDSIKNWLTAPTSKAKLAEAMHGAAHPQEIADFLPLLIPGSAGMATARAAQPAVNEARASTNALATKVATSEAAQKTIGATAGGAAGWTVGHPVIGAGVGGRFGGQLVKGAAEGVEALTGGRALNPNDVPLYKQMESLPAGAAGPITTGGRVASPPMRPSVAAQLSDIELARQEFAAGRLPKAVLDAMEKQAARGTPAAAGRAPVIAAPGPVSDFERRIVDDQRAQRPATVTTPITDQPPLTAAEQVRKDFQDPARVQRANAMNAKADAVPRAAAPEAAAPLAKVPPKAMNELVLLGIRAKTPLSPTEVTAGQELLKSGLKPVEVLAELVKRRSAVTSPSAAFAAQFGTPDDEQMAAQIAARQYKR